MEAEISHPLLLSQVRDHYGAQPILDAATLHFLREVQRTYYEGDALRDRMQRSLSLSLEGLLSAAPGRAVLGPMTSPPPRPRTVLCICKEGGISRLIDRMLSSRGFRVLEAGGPTCAREQARAYSGEIDLVILDALFPDTTGVLLLDQLKPHLRGPAILLTDRPVPGEGCGPRFSALLRKPFSVGELGELVRKALDGPLVLEGCLP